MSFVILNDVIQKRLDSFHEKDHLLIRDGLLYAKVQKIITYAIILTILLDYFAANVYLLIFSLQKKHIETL